MWASVVFYLIQRFSTSEHERKNAVSKRNVRRHRHTGPSRGKRNYDRQKRARSHGPVLGRARSRENKGILVTQKSTFLKILIKFRTFIRTANRSLES